MPGVLKQVVNLDVDPAATMEQSLVVRDLTRSSGRVTATTDPVALNSDFDDILRNDTDYFICNDIVRAASVGDYRNSHASDGRALTYNSALVRPIRKVFDYASLGTDGTEDGQDFLAFLCVDSPATGAFAPTEIEFAGVLADALYVVLKPYLLTGD